MTSQVVSQEFTNGSTYEGHVNDAGQRNGKGIMYFYENPQLARLKEGSVYCGDWKNDKFQGIGTYIFENGERYLNFSVYIISKKKKIDLKESWLMV